jgi:ribosomal protein S18 acetylase RimI-like enzyme
VTDSVLRRAGPGDAGRLALLGAATFLHAFAHDHPGDALVAHAENNHSRAWYDRVLADPDRALWIVETPLKAPIGYAILQPPALNHPTEPGDLELLRIYVLSPWQSEGWGAKLVAAAGAEARARGAGQLLLCVYDANRRAQAFYARQGFIDTGSRQDFMVGDVPFLDQIWAKPLIG